MNPGSESNVSFHVKYHGSRFFFFSSLSAAPITIWAIISTSWFQPSTAVIWPKPDQYRYGPPRCSLWSSPSVCSWYFSSRLFLPASLSTKSWSILPSNLVRTHTYTCNRRRCNSRCVWLDFPRFLQALIWGWTSSWWLSSRAYIWDPPDYPLGRVLSLTLRKLRRNFTRFFPEPRSCHPDCFGSGYCSVSSWIGWIIPITLYCTVTWYLMQFASVLIIVKL